jgi:GNAT superfamily N-acetyltransferase
MSPSAYTVRLATAADQPALPAIERAAAESFRSTPHPQMADAPLASEHVAADDIVWVVVDAQHAPVGFAIVRRFTASMHLQEIDVHPDHAGQRLGARLIDAIARWAQAQGASALTLSTCADVPWNAPYYARLGFKVLTSAELTSELQEVCRLEAAAGLPMAHRVCMRLHLR